MINRYQVVKMQEIVSTEKLNEEHDKQIHSNPTAIPGPGKLPESADNGRSEVEPVITSEEFNSLEKTESKKKIFGFLKNLGAAKNTRNDDSVSADDNGTEKKLNDLMLKIEKLEGKFEMLDSSKSEHGDRMSNISEEIGELRSMIFSREETLGGIESEFRTIKEATAQIRPEKIAKDLESYSKDLMKAQAQSELEKSKVDRLEGELQKITDILDKIKSYENILEAAKDIKKQVDKIKDSEKYTERMAAKSEKIFGELDTRLLEFQKYKKDIEDSGEMIKDVVKSVDGLEIKIESLMPKDSFSKVKDETDTKIRDVDTRLKRLKDIVAELIERTYSNRGSSSDLDAIKSTMHGEIAAGLAKQDAVYLGLKAGFEEKSEELEELERKFREISGAVLSLENNASYVKESMRDSKAAGRERVPCIESKVDDAAKQLEKETHKHICELDSKFRDISSSVENIEDKIGYLKECIDHESSAGSGFRPAIGAGILKSPHVSDAIHSDAEVKIIPKTSGPQRSPSVAGSFGSSSSSGSLQIASDFAAAEKICGSLRDHLDMEKRAESGAVKAISKENAFQPKIKSSISSSYSKKDPADDIRHLKTLLDDLQKKIDLDKSGGLDISERQILVDNGSLHLGMAELDILDGDESASLQKIEKVKSLLEKS